MPELPEVETVVRALRKPLVGRKILAFTTDWEKALKIPTSLREFAQKIVGQKVTSVFRRAKYVCIALSAYTLVVHLRMSGEWILHDSH
jgi:formamidopyrimidine-DNA glycosylase